MLKNHLNHRGGNFVQQWQIEDQNIWLPLLFSLVPTIEVCAVCITEIR